jgi:hypothetical protein
MRKLYHALAIALAHFIVLLTAHGIAVEVGALVRDEFLVNYAEKALAMVWEP